MAKLVGPGRYGIIPASTLSAMMSRTGPKRINHLKVQKIRNHAFKFSFAFCGDSENGNLINSKIIKAIAMSFQFIRSTHPAQAFGHLNFLHLQSFTVHFFADL